MEALYKMFNWMYDTTNNVLFHVFKSVLQPIEEKYLDDIDSLKKLHHDEVSELKDIIVSKNTQIQFYQNEIKRPQEEKVQSGINDAQATIRSLQKKNEELFIENKKLKQKIDSFNVYNDKSFDYVFRNVTKKLRRGF